MGIYNEKASLISGIFKISMVILIACLINITNVLAEKESFSPEHIEYIVAEKNIH